MKVLLIAPPYTSEEGFSSMKRIGPILPPLGLAQIASVLEKENIQVDIVDSPTLSYNIDKIKQKIIEKRPNIVGISVITLTYKKSLAIAKLVKEISKDILVLFGGPHVSVYPKYIIKNNKDIDIILCGEAESTISELLRCIVRKIELKKVRGIVFRKNDKIIQTAKRELIGNLDKLPFPAYNLIPIEKYRPAPNTFKKQPLITMVVSRGCPLNCILCSKSVFGRSYRTKSPKNVVSEI